MKSGKGFVAKVVYPELSRISLLRELKSYTMGDKKSDVLKKKVSRV
jgi:hypothetical protein